MLSLQTFLQRNQQAVQHLASNNKIFIYPNIPHAKLRGAIASYLDGVKPQEVLILVDNTMMGGAREGLAITGKGVFFKETPFDGATYHVLESVNAIGCDNSLFGGTKVTFNNSSTIDFNGPDRQSIIALVRLLNDYLQQREQIIEETKTKKNRPTKKMEKEPTADQDELGFVISMIDVLLHYAALNSKDFNDEGGDFLLNVLSYACPDTRERTMILKSRIHAYPRPSLTTSMQNFLSFQPNQELKDSFITSLAMFMHISEFDKNDANQYINEAGQQLGMTATQVIKALKSFFQNEEVDNDEETETDQDDQVIWACKILEIKTNQINRDAVLKSYRLKMKDFHPDKYQSLPEPIMRMLHEKAQELNKAKDILSVLF